MVDVNILTCIEPNGTESRKHPCDSAHTFEKYAAHYAHAAFHFGFAGGGQAHVVGLGHPAQQGIERDDRNIKCCDSGWSNNLEHIRILYAFTQARHPSYRGQSEGQNQKRKNNGEYPLDKIRQDGSTQAARDTVDNEDYRHRADGNVRIDLSARYRCDHGGAAFEHHADINR